MSAMVILIFGLTAGNTLAGSKIYKCADDHGAVTFQNIPCHADDQPVKVRDSSFGASTSSGEIVIEDNACIQEGRGWTKATGFLHNQTNSAHTVKLTATFLREGTVVDSVTLPYSIDAWSKVPFSIQGGQYNADSCDYRWRWN